VHCAAAWARTQADGLTSSSTICFFFTAHVFLARLSNSPPEVAMFLILSADFAKGGGSADDDLIDIINRLCLVRRTVEYSVAKFAGRDVESDITRP